MSQLGLSSSSSTRVAPTYTTGTSFVPAPWSANCRSHRVGSGSVSRAEGDGRPLYRRYARAPRLPSRPLGSLTQRAQESGGCSGSGSGRAGQGAAFPVEYRTPCSLCNDTKPRPQTRRGGVSRVQTLPCADCSGSGVPRGVACRLVVALIHTNVHPLDSGRARERVPSHRGRVRRITSTLPSSTRGCAAGTATATTNDRTERPYAAVLPPHTALPKPASPQSVSAIGCWLPRRKNSGRAARAFRQRKEDETKQGRLLRSVLLRCTPRFEPAHRHMPIWISPWFSLSNPPHVPSV